MTAPKAPWSGMTSSAASPIAAIESRGDGSASTCDAPRPGSWSRTASAWAAPVTTTTRYAVSGSSRSTVVCSSERPLPVRSRRNLGWPARLNGHSRVPAPPAGTTAQKPGMLVTRSAAEGEAVDDPPDPVVVVDVELDRLDPEGAAEVGQRVERA